MGLGAVPGRQAAFREGLEQAVLYAKALGCPRYPVLPSLDHRAGWEESCEQRHCCGRGLCRLLFVFHLLSVMLFSYRDPVLGAGVWLGS